MGVITPVFPKKPATLCFKNVKALPIRFLPEQAFIRKTAKKAEGGRPGGVIFGTGER